MLSGRERGKEGGRDARNHERKEERKKMREGNSNSHRVVVAFRDEAANMDVNYTSSQYKAPRWSNLTSTSV